ncbi:ABC-three component system middle component 6 [Pseudomonas amygdali]|jgi:hypothetical protein
MFLPAKHITFAESLLGLGSFVLAKLSEPMTVDQVWRVFERDSKNYPSYQNFENLVLAIDALYAIGVVSINEYGELERREVDVSICA